MKNEKNFDDILKSKFDDQQVPFDEQNWQSMRQMIDASRADKKRVLWLAASICLVLLAGGGIAMYSLDNNKGKVNTASTVSSTSNSTQTAITSNDKQLSESNQSKTQQSVTNTGTNVQSDNHQIANANSGAINKNTIALNQSTVINEAAKQADANKLQRHAKRNRNITNSGNVSVANNAVASAGLNQPKPDAAGSNAQAIADNNGVTNGSAIGKGQSVSISPGSEKTSQAENKVASASTQSTIHKADSAGTGTIIPQRFSDEPRIFMGKTNIFSLDAALEYAGGWQIGSVVQGKGLNYTVGLGYQHYLGSRIFLRTGLQFSTFGNMSPLTYNYQHSIGNVIYDSVITTQRLYFLKVPVQAEYFIGRNKRSSIGAGGSVWILLGNSGYATTYQQADNNPPVDIVKHTQNTPLPGYKEIDLSAHLFYRCILSRKLSMYFILYQELTNMKDNSFFGENIIQRSKGVQFMLSYNLN